MLGIDFLYFCPPKHLLLEAHVGGVVEGGWILAAGLPFRGSLDLYYTSFRGPSALNVGDIPEIKDKIASVFTTLMTWANHSTAEGLVGTFVLLSPFPLLHSPFPPPPSLFPGPSSSTTTFSQLPAV